METEYQKAKDGAQQSAALNKRITDIGGRIDDIVRRAATYADDIKGFMDNIELNVFLPKMAANLSVEINNILRIKQELQESSTGAYPLETLRDVTAKIIDYLKELSLCSPEVDEENVVKHIVAVQNSTNRQDPFDYLDSAEIAALKSLVNRGSNNQYIALYRQRQDLEVLLATIEELRTERKNLEQTRSGGNEFIISTYEESQRKIEKAKIQEANSNRRFRSSKTAYTALMCRFSKSLT